MGTPGAPIPALLKRRSNLPNSSLVLVNRERTEPGLLTSVGTTSIPFTAVCSSCAARRPARTTRNPAACNARLAARPIPLPAPVTIATLGTTATLVMSMRAGGAAQCGHAGGDIGGHGEDAAESRKVEYFAHPRLRAHQHESPIRLFRDGGINGDEKSDRSGTNGGHFAEIDQHFPAGELLQLLRLAAQVFRIEAGGEATLTAQDANVVDLVQLDH